MERKTPLYQTHVDAGGKIVEFGGFLMPVQYPTGVLAEHMAVRQKAGLFDVSHMGELRLKGPDAVANVQKLITADISAMQDGDIKYAMFCNDAGGIIDDFIVYRCAADDYWLVVNAGNRDKDAAWVESHLFGDVDYRDEGDDWGQVALQGPKSGDILKKLCAEQYIPAKYYTFIDNVPLDLGSRKAIKNVSKLIWYPAEVDVSIRKGWFYHLNEDYEVKPLSKLMEIYYNSVGANASLLLNIPPNKDGLFAQRDVETLLAMGAQLQIDFNEDLADDSIMTDSCHLDEEHRGQMALTHTTDEYWHSGFDPDHATLTLDLGDDYDIDKIVLSEHIATGQQIEKFSLYGQINGKWKKIFAGTVIGSKRICRFEEARMQYIKLVIEETRCFATIARFEAY